jgi:hypothetical protein
MTITVYSASRTCPASLHILAYLDAHGVEHEHYLPFPELLAHMQSAHRYDDFPHVWIDDVFLGSASEFWKVVEWRAVHGHDEWRTGR